MSRSETITVLDRDHFIGPDAFVAQRTASSFVATERSGASGLYPVRSTDRTISSVEWLQQIATREGDLFDTSIDDSNGSKRVEGPRVGLEISEGRLIISYWRKMAEAAVINNDGRIDGRYRSGGGEIGIIDEKLTSQIKDQTGPGATSSVLVETGDRDILLQPADRGHYSGASAVGVPYQRIVLPGGAKLQEQIAQDFAFEGIDEVATTTRERTRLLRSSSPGLIDYSVSSSYVYDVRLRRELTTDELTDGKALFNKTVKESSGFLQWGHNDSRVVRALSMLNGIPITELEMRMRPGAYSREGFLGLVESLNERLAEDNEFVLGAGLSHLKVAEPLKKIQYYHSKNLLTDPNNDEKYITINGKTYLVGATRWMGYQFSPFEDGLRSSTDFRVTDLTNGRTIHFSSMLPDLIAKYGFYEGNTPYRLSPQTIIEVFGLKQ